MHAPIKVGHFTLDNAANNQTFMKSLQTLLASRDVPFDADDRKVMCFAHTVDLSSGRVIRAVGADGSPSDGSSSDDSDESSGESLDPISLARAVVRAIRGSGTRREAFEEIIEAGNAGGWFMEGHPPKTTKVEQRQLLRDVQTRWDSVYWMLNRLREMRPVCFMFHRISCALNNQFNRLSTTSLLFPKTMTLRSTGFRIRSGLR